MPERTLPLHSQRQPIGPGRWAGVWLATLAAAPPLWAQQPAPGTAAAPQQVEISATAPDSTDARRRSTAAKIVVGRDEIERLGDSSVGEILKRLPGVTVAGRPGRGGDVRMRGLGNGYTQILIDGERLPRGFTLDSIEPDQIERIEILRAPTAETGARAIAGTINIVLREDVRRKQNDVRLALGSEQGRPQTSASWTRSDQAGALDYTVTATASQRQQADDTLLHTVGRDGTGTTTLDQVLHSLSQSRQTTAFASARLRWRDGRDSWELQPFLNHSEGRSAGSSTLVQAIGANAAPYDSASGTGSNSTTLSRLTGQWLHLTDAGGRLQLRGGASLAQSDSGSDKLQWRSSGVVPQHLTDDSTQRDQSLNASAKYSVLVADAHSLVSGLEFQANQRDDHHVSTQDGVNQLADFGDEVQARTVRLAGYVQDEWSATQQLALNAGLRWEQIDTRSDSAMASVHNTSAVWTPLLHAVWRLPGAPRDQLRLSLTRSYRSPTTSQLIARPTLSSLYPAGGSNQPTSPDRAGNPNLRPELATGVDLAFEHYLEGAGNVSANVFVRHIDNLIRNVRSQQAVVWSPVERWVSTPQNIGGAVTSGIELEAKGRAADLGLGPWPLTVRGNVSLFRSRVDQVPGPDNRLDQQPRWTANLGADYALPGTRLTVGGNLNYTPAFTVRQLDAQVYDQGLKRVIDAYALWRLDAQTQLRLSLANLAARDYDSATTVLLDGGASQRQDSLARTWTVATLRLELHF
jgi:iron complex outermembrane receptor protein